MMVLGGDFWFSNTDDAIKLFDKLELLISNAYKIPDFTIRFSTASDYFDRVKSLEVPLATFENDFLPYQSYRFQRSSTAYWTGFYSTRPKLKKLIYETHRLVRSAEIASSLILGENFQAYNTSLALHHDAITGTCRLRVCEDYMDRLNFDSNQANLIIQKSIQSVFTQQESKFDLILPYKILIIYNSLNWDKTDLLHIDTEYRYLEIRDWLGKTIQAQIVKNELGDHNYTIYFKLKVPGLAFISLFVTEHSYPCESCAKDSELNTETKVLKDDYNQVEINQQGMIVKINQNELIQEF